MTSPGHKQWPSGHDLKLAVAARVTAARDVRDPPRRPALRRCPSRCSWTDAAGLMQLGRPAAPMQTASSLVTTAGGAVVTAGTPTLGSRRQAVLSHGSTFALSSSRPPSLTEPPATAAPPPPPPPPSKSRLCTTVSAGGGRRRRSQRAVVTRR